MPSNETLARQTKSIALLSTVLISVVVVVGLSLARDILLPFALAILLSFLLTPVVELFERLRIGRISSVLIVVASSFCVIGLLSFVLVQQLYDLAYKLPEYKTNIINKADAFRTQQGGIVDRVQDTFEGVLDGIALGGEPAPALPSTISADPSDPVLGLGGQEPPVIIERPPAAKAAPPVPVKIVDNLTAQEVAAKVLGPIIGPLGTAAMVLIFLIFMLIKREDLRNRLIHLIGSKQLSLTTKALDDAARRVSRYLLMQLIINTVYGVATAIGLGLIGLPNAMLWGALTAVLRFIPYAGPWIGAVIPMALSLAVFDGWTKPIMVFSLFMVNELISNNFMEPWLYGASTGISTMGILVSAVFWTWLWGPIGLVMATPLTVCLTVVGRYVPQLSLLNTLLSDQEVLTPETRFYQRLLAEDPDEAIEVAEQFLKEGKTVEELYDSVLVPALCLAQHDYRQGDLDEMKIHFVNQTVRELVDDLADRQIVEAAVSAESEQPAAIAPVDMPLILCLPARDETDEVAATMLAQILKTRGCEVHVISTKALASEMLEQVSQYAPDGVCVSAVPPFASSTARYLAKRLRQKFPQLRIVAGLWQKDTMKSRAEERVAASGIDRMEHSLAAAVEELLRLVSSDKLLDPVDTTAEEQVRRSTS